MNNATILRDLEQYMFSSKNMLNYNKTVVVVAATKPSNVLEPSKQTVVAATKPVNVLEPSHVDVTKPVNAPEPSHVAATKPVNASEPSNNRTDKDSAFTPFQKDKLFWCFYVLLNGFTEYELHRTGFYAVEKTFKINSVEKLRTMKQGIKDLKLKINEVEDELVNKECITLKGLQVLCLVYKVSVTYIYGKKYCEFLYSEDDNIKGIIQQDNKKHSLLYEEAVDLEAIKNTHWFIENLQKPLKAPTAYTLKELQDICEKLEVDIKHTTGKSKTKKDLYEDILSHV